MSMFFIDPYRFGEQPDPYWADVAVLIHCDGVAGSSSFPDSGPLGLPTGVGSTNARVSTSNTKFNGSAAFSFASTSFLEVQTTDPVISFGASAWTAECWFYHIPGSWPSLLSKQNGADSGSLIRTNEFRCGLNGPTVVQALSWTNPPQEQWHHIAVCRDGVNLYAFINGELVASRSDVTSISYSSNYLGIGEGTASKTQPFAGNIEEIRWTNVCRYTADFPVPTAPFPNF